MADRSLSSFVGMSSLRRVGIVLLLVLPLWLGVWWALS
jgi:hypothetical protein